MLPLLPKEAPTEESSSRRQIVLGAIVIGSVGVLAVIIWSGKRLPGFAGEFFSMVAGLVSTPFLMEASIVLLGFFIVIGLNAWRAHRDGDEFVYLDEIDTSEKVDVSKFPDESSAAEEAQTKEHNAE